MILRCQVGSTNFEVDVPPEFEDEWDAWWAEALTDPACDPRWQQAPRPPRRIDPMVV